MPVCACVYFGVFEHALSLSLCVFGRVALVNAAISIIYTRTRTHTIFVNVTLRLSTLIHWNSSDNHDWQNVIFNV